MSNFIGNIKAVALREMCRWKEYPIYFVAPLAIMVFCSIFYLTFLSCGLPSDLPIGVVDYDNSSTSRNFIRQLDATQLGKVIHFDNYSEARSQMQSGKLTSVCLIPKYFAEDLQASRQPKMTIYINGLYFVGGSLSYQDLLTMIYLTSGAVQKQVLTAKGISEQQMKGLLRPVNIDLHKIGNPLTSYNSCLSTNMLPGTLQMLIILITIFSLGTELKYNTSRSLLERADGSIGSVIFGKVSVYTIFFTLLGFLTEILLYGSMKFPIEGSIWNMFLNMFLLVLASEAAAVFFISLVPNCRFAMSFGAIYSVLSFSFTGFTLPVEVMPRILQGFSYIFPLRHYYLIEVLETMYGTGFTGWWKEVLWMLSFWILPILSLPRLKREYIAMDDPKY